MYTLKVYKAKDMIRWTRFETYSFIAYIVIIVALYEAFDLHWLKIPLDASSPHWYGSSLRDRFSEQLSIWADMGSAKDLGWYRQHLPNLWDVRPGHGDQGIHVPGIYR